MTDQIFNISKGAFAEKIRDTGTKTGVALFKVIEADDALVDHDEMNALKGAAGNTIADFTNYADKIDVVETLTVDDTNNRVDVDIPDQTWTSAGGGTNNTLVKLITFYNQGAGDTNQIPMSHHDFAVTTDGSDLTAQINAAGIMRAA
jgi:hypothetical protein